MHSCRVQHPVVFRKGASKWLLKSLESNLPFALMPFCFCHEARREIKHRGRGKLFQKHVLAIKACNMFS